MASSDLSRALEEMLDTAYGMIHRERVVLSRKEAAEWVLGLLHPPVFEEVIRRNRGQFSDVTIRRLRGRLYYIRAAALWLTGKKAEARGSYSEAEKVLGTSQEREMCDGIMK